MNRILVFISNRGYFPPSIADTIQKGDREGVKEKKVIDIKNRIYGTLTSFSISFSYATEILIKLKSKKAF